MKTIRILLLSMVLLLSSFNVFCQQKIVVIDSTKDGEIKFARVSDKVHSVNSLDSKNFLLEVLNSGENDDFYLYKTIKDELGITHEKFQQTFKGIKVEFGEFIVHKNDSSDIFEINGNFIRIPDEFGIECKLKFDEVMNILNKEEEYKVTELQDHIVVDESPTKEYEIVIIKGDDGALHLTYKINLMTSIFENFLGYVDCETSWIVFKQPLTYDANASGSAATLYSGNVNITTDTYSGGYRLFESSRSYSGTGIKTYNFNRAPAYSYNDITTGIANASIFSDNDNNWTDAEYNNANHDIAALDSHWAFERTFDYFYSVHSRNSINGSGGLITNYVHVRDRDSYGNVVEMDNAFWSGTFNAIFLGDGNVYNPVVSMDVVGHEYAHGICFYAIGNGTGLIMEKESGALSESLSDIWGACVEDWATDNKHTWIIGEEIVSNGLRSMSFPDSSSQPMTYAYSPHWVNVTNCTPTDYNDNCGVHTNSGVGNYWFYLLVNGGVGTNDLGNHYVVSGIGITKAAQIVYKMETTYLTSTSTYSDARTGSISASTLLFGENSNETIAVKNAWYAVGIGSEVVQFITGNYFSCYPSTNTYSLPSGLNGYSITWSTSSNIDVISGQGTNVVTVRKKSSSTSGTGTITAVYNHGTGNKTSQKAVWVGVPTLSYISGPSSGSIYNTYMFDAVQYNVNAQASYSWTLSPSFGNPVYNYGYYANITFNNPGDYQVSVQAQNGCGSLYSYQNISIFDDGKGLGRTNDLNKDIETSFNNKDSFNDNDELITDINGEPLTNAIKFIISPNPAAELVTITTNGSLDYKNPFSVKVIDYAGLLKYSTTYYGHSITIPISQFKNGSYIVVIGDNNRFYNYPLIIKH